MCVINMIKHPIDNLLKQVTTEYNKPASPHI